MIPVLLESEECVTLNHGKSGWVIMSWFWWSQTPTEMACFGLTQFYARRCGWEPWLKGYPVSFTDNMKLNPMPCWNLKVPIIFSSLPPNRVIVLDHMISRTTFHVPLVPRPFPGSSFLIGCSSQFLIAWAIKNWRWGRSGNEARLSHHSALLSVASQLASRCII